MSLAEKLAANSRRAENGCLEWTGGINDKGYGRLCVDGGYVRAHRASWKLANGPIPGGLTVCHHCDNRRCIDPAHLFLGTNADNVADMCRKGRVTKGVTNSQAVLTEDIVRSIVASDVSTYALAQQLGVSRRTVRDVRSGRYWSHVTGITHPTHQPTQTQESGA